MRDYLLLALILPVLVGLAAGIVSGARAQAQTTAACGPAPSAPPQTEGWAFQRADGSWTTLVPGWLAAPAPACWVLGRVELKEPDTQPDMPADQDPGPWVYGEDTDVWPLGTCCPKNAPGGCYAPPHPAVPLPASCP